ncbi:transmembrane protein 80 isoform X3 [Elephas maximus indicus]|uniref:transmembrane protein 80 isoform X3 n=1 Tax=Elephas maximus indicus TaxID=99487 RepID=UPI0021172964|nr:transmembrane protein 80 isoform X3 [Elephas maximus indicus]
MFPSPKPPPRASALRLLLSESARALPDGLLGPRPRFGCQLLRRRSAGPLREQKRKWPKGRERRGAQRLPGSRRTRRAGAGQDGGPQARPEKAWNFPVTLPRLTKARSVFRPPWGLWRRGAEERTGLGPSHLPACCQAVQLERLFPHTAFCHIPALY